MRRLLLLFFGSLSCSFLVRAIDATECDEDLPRCEGSVLLTCEEGFLKEQDCGLLVCNDTAGGFCGSCGNGVLDPGESCDDGNLIDGDGCESNCTIADGCGDGLLDPNEECDDGDTDSNDGCSNLCRLEANEFVLCGAATNGDGDLTNPFNSLSAALADSGTTNEEIVMILPQSPSPCDGSGIITKNITIQGLADPTDPNAPLRPTINAVNSRAIHVNNGPTVTVRDLILSADFNGEGAFLQTGDLALLRVEITNLSSGNSSAAVGCDSLGGGAARRLLIDQSVVHDSPARGVLIKGSCLGVISNSLFLRDGSGLNGAINLELAAARADILYSTFDLNSSDANNGSSVDSPALSQCRLDSSIVHNTNSGPALLNCTTTFTDTFGQTSSGAGNLDQDPQFVTSGAGLASTFHLGAASPCRAAANPNPFALVFDPVAVFGVDPRSHDINGTPRNQASSDMGIFEEP